MAVACLDAECRRITVSLGGADPTHSRSPVRARLDRLERRAAAARRGSSGRPPPDSLAFASRHADLDSPRRHLGVFLLSHEIDLGRPDIRMPGKLGTSCIDAPFRMASFIAVFRSEWMPMPRPPSRSGSMPARGSSSSPAARGSSDPGAAG